MLLLLLLKLFYYLLFIVVSSSFMLKMKMRVIHIIITCIMWRDDLAAHVRDCETDANSKTGNRSFDF